MIESVLRTIEQYSMFQKEDSVMVCVSGGADSMALLHYLYTHREDLGIGELTACHLNHGLRGEESDGEERMVREYCAVLGVPLTVERAHMSQSTGEKGESIELRARNLRYAFFERCAGEKTTRIAVAHTQNDNAETVLFNLARGTGLRGAGGIPPVRGRYVRPLIGTSRQQVEAYCAANGIPFAVDSSNASDAYARNRIRHNVVPALQSVNAAAVRNLAAFSLSAAEAAAFVDEEARALLNRAWTKDGYRVDVLREGKDILLRGAMKLLVEEVCEPTRDNVRRCCDVVYGTNNGVQLKAGVTFCRSGGLVYLKFDNDTLEDICMPLEEGENLFCEGVKVLCVTEEVDIHNSDKETLKNILNNCIDCAKIEGSLFLRARKAGDRFVSQRRGVTKSLKNIFQERGIKAEDRGHFPLVCDEGGIAFIPGEGPSARHAATQKTVTVKRIHLLNTEEKQNAQRHFEGFDQ